MPALRFVVLGTGTGVGKTWVTVALARSLVNAGVRVSAHKPIESGVTPETLGESDAALLAKASARELAHCYALSDPVSPHLAARRAGVELDLHRVARFVLEREADSELSLVEVAGGAFSPLGSGATNASLAPLLAEMSEVVTELLLVAPDRLGVLHDLGATLLALGSLAGSSPAPRVRAVLLSGVASTDDSSGTNAAELEREVFPHLGLAAPLDGKVFSVARGGSCDEFVRERILPRLVRNVR